MRRMGVMLVVGMLGMGMAQATPVVYSAERFTGTMNNRAITIRLTTQGIMHGTNAVFGPALPLQPTNGVARFNLDPANYTLEIDGVTTLFPFQVPDSTNSYSIWDLVNRGIYVLASGTNAPKPMAMAPGENVVAKTNADGTGTLWTLSAPGLASSNSVYTASNSLAAYIVSLSNLVQSMTSTTNGLTAAQVAAQIASSNLLSVASLPSDLVTNGMSGVGISITGNAIANGDTNRVIGAGAPFDGNLYWESDRSFFHFDSTVQAPEFHGSFVGNLVGPASQLSGSLSNWVALVAGTNGAGSGTGGVSLASVPVIVGTVTNADRYGVKHDGRLLTGNITSGSAAITLTDGSVSSADVGAHVRVRMGTSYSQDAVGTILSVTPPSTFTLSKSLGVSTNGADLMIAKTDDADAIQSIVNDFGLAGMTILCEPGHYWLGHQITFPDVGHSDALVSTINFVGANSVLGNWTGGFPSSWRIPASATVFWSGEEVGSGDALFGGSGHLGRVRFENIIFRLPTNPNMIGLDATDCGGLITKLCVWDTGFAEYDPRIPLPTHTNGIAVRYPRAGNSGGGTSRLEGGLIAGGFYYGIVHGEHMVASVAIENCINAVTPIDCNQALFEYFDVEGCVTAINMTNSTYPCGLRVNAGHFENTLNGWWTSQTLVNDPNNMLSATIAMDSVGTNVGGSHLDINSTGTSSVKLNSTLGVGSLTFDKSVSAAGWAEIKTDDTVNGLVLKSHGNDVKAFGLMVSPLSDYLSPTAPSFMLYFPANYSELKFQANFASGGAPQGMPMRFYPLNYSGTGYALSIETNGNIVAGRGSFVGNGSGMTNLNPANLSAGTAPINVSGSSSFATTAGTATNLAKGAAITNSTGTHYLASGASGFGLDNASPGYLLDISGNVHSSGIFLSDSSGFRVNNTVLHDGLIDGNGSALTALRLRVVSLTVDGSITSSNGLILPGQATIKWTGVTSTNPQTSGSGTAFIYAATNGAGTAEIFTMDGAGVIKQISEHAMDAPSQLIDDSDEAPNISKEILPYTGKVRWINRSREARQFEMVTKLELNSLAYYQFTTGKTATQWTNSNAYGFYTNAVAFVDPLTAAQKQIVMVESFSDYNARLGLTNGNGLAQVSWTGTQNRLQADYAGGYTNALASYQAAVSAGSTNAVAPIWSPPAVQPVPGWLHTRGVN